MNCSCIQPKGFDFKINYLCEDNILYNDYSLWVEGPGYEIPYGYTITIENKDLNYKEEQLVTIDKPTKLHKLKDGIYTVSALVCGVFYSRYVAILPKMRCCLDRYKTQENYDPKIGFEMENLYSFVEVNTLYGQEKVAKDFYELLMKKIARLNCNC